MRREMFRKMVLPKESLLAYSTFVRLHARMPHLKDKRVKWVKCTQISDAINVRARHPEMTSPYDLALICKSTQHSDKSTISWKENHQSKKIRLYYFTELFILNIYHLFMSQLSLAMHNCHLL